MHEGTDLVELWTIQWFSVAFSCMFSVITLNQGLKQPCVSDCDDTQSKFGGANPGRWWIPNFWRDEM